MDPQLKMMILTQMSRGDTLKYLLELAGSDEAMQLSDVELQLELLDQTWTQFDQMHSAIAMEATEELFTDAYMTNDVHGKTYRAYAAAKKAWRRRQTLLTPAPPPPAEHRTGTSEPKLPAIPVKEFDGNYADWKEFSDMFQSLVGKRGIDDVEKLHHLKRALKGNAAALIANLTVTDENYTVAWNCLVSRYENKRLLINSHLQRLFNLQKLKNKSATGLLTVVHTVEEALDALAALGAPTEQWDIIVGYRIQGLMDPVTREAWEVHLGSQTEPPALKELMEFLTARARAYENVERENLDNRQQQQTEKPPAKRTGRAHNATAGGNQQSSKTCSKCSGDHVLGAACSDFVTLGRKGRRDYVRDNKLCFNCLGSDKHSANNCPSPNRCRLCKGLHHTLIHYGSPGDKPEDEETETATVDPKEKKPWSEQTEDSKKSNGGTADKNSSSLTRPVNTPTSSSTAVLQGQAGLTAGPSSSTAVLQGQAGLTAGPSSSTAVLQGQAGLTAGPSSSTAVHQGQAGLTAGHSSSTAEQQMVLLATARAEALSSHGLQRVIRMLIDQGSELSFISEALAQKLHLQRRSSSVQILGIGGSESGSTRGVVTVNLQSLFDHTHQVEITAQILKRLTTQLPSFSCKTNSADHLQGLQLADKHFLTPGAIEIIIGADYYGMIIGNQIIKSEDKQLVAQQTIFGWIVSGPVCCSTCTPRNSLSAVRKTSAEQLLDLLKRFWIQEEPKSQTWSELSPEELECELHFQQTHTRDEDGRYVVRLPLKTTSAALGDSRNTALRMLQRIRRRLTKDAAYNQLYSDFLKEYESLGHMRRAPDSPDGTAYYLPHHGVLREDSITTKLRVVFNGSSQTSTGVSLNDILHSGAKLQTDNTDVLLWLRRHRLVFGTDIKQMFRQIKVHPEDWNLQRILWIDEEQRIIPFQLTTVIYGQNCAPWLALRALQQLAEDEGHRFPRAVPTLTKGRYVDDIYGGAETTEDLKRIIRELQDLCMAGGFPLQKWISNCPDTLQQLRLSSESSPTTVQFEESLVKVLGLGWHPHSDMLRYKSKSFTSSNFTKRTVLSEIAQIFDPLGLITPVIIRAKILIQELWLAKLGWDDTLPAHFIRRWRSFREELAHLDSLMIPRWLQLQSSATSVQIHGFADASSTAMGAAVYLRVQEENSDPTVILVLAKSRVAPLKQMTIPRLELTAAVLLAEITAYVKKMLEMETLQLHLWTDSSVTLAWVNSNPSRWKEFVRNRVSKIQDLVPDGQWRHISGTDNPADCASRGISPTELAEHPLWWHGPDWLIKPQNQWPVSSLGSTAEAALEERPETVQAFPVTLPPAAAVLNILERYSTLSKILAVTATVTRVYHRFTRRPAPNSPVLEPQELEDARIFWVGATQRQFYAREMELLSQGSVLPNRHPLSRLVPYLDEDHLLRLGGRLKNSILDPEEKHPAILPRDSRLSHLVIDEAHRKTLHGGTQLTLAYIRQKYWIIGGRVPVRSFILKCVICARNRGQLAQQLMAQLPTPRITPSRPFLHTGIDYAGPIDILKHQGRGAQKFKGWIAVFVCFSTSAVHLEVVMNNSSAAFLTAFKRFTGRRGICATLYSDRGTTLLGADRELRELLDQSSKGWKLISGTLATSGTKWIFNPAAAPHFGGKWEAAVKSVKHHLRRVVGDLHLNYEELTTLMVQIEAILNSRPLCPMTEDPEDFTALTPAHFLIGEPLTAVPEPSLADLPIGRLSKQQRISLKAQQFWEKYYKEYVQRFQAISKWRHPSTEIKVGSMVLLSNEHQPPTRWPLARVMELHPGPDGLVRVVTIKTATTTRTETNQLVRPVHKLCVLPVDPEHTAELEQREAEANPA